MKDKIQKIIQSVSDNFAPDKRVEVFAVTSAKRKESYILKGETSSREAYEQLSARVKELPNVKNRVRLLPDDKTGDQTWGIVYNSVGVIHSAAKYGSETVSQTLLGTPVRVLDKQGEWLRVQMPDRYIGWINGAVHRVTKEELRSYNKLPKIIVTSLHAQSFSGESEDSQPVSDLVMGNLLVLSAEREDFYQVKYPDERVAFVPKKDAQLVTQWLQRIELTGESLAAMAARLMGVPYIWGGTSPGGLDCSGFTKTVYFNHGVILPRDASQQAMVGKLVDEKGDLSDARAGDLLFFGTKPTKENQRERVVHVGMYLGDNRFIHASDFIRVNSFDPDNSLYDANNAKRYLRTKRIIGCGNEEGVETIFENEFYRY